MKLFILLSCVCCVVFTENLNKKQILKDLDALLDEQQLEKLSDYLKTNKAAYRCEDDVTTKASCKHWAEQGGCKLFRETMRRYCSKTCELCSPPAPPIPDLPACSKSAHGCCWDNITVARGPTENIVASQCPPCLDKQSEQFCLHWSEDCYSPVKGQGDVMRNICPVSCAVPCEFNLNIHKCKDKSPSCIEWFKDGKCIDEEEKMHAFCPSICGFCNV